ncbi:hypothetical protein ACFVDI_16265 [Nocardioides sp. NPDC057767]|uniref:hypothetical protein n=1 Tax=unclassified Nocardioides TaxID=2615069 RepID=UPI0036707F29
MRTSGIYFSYRGHDYQQSFSGDAWIGLDVAAPDPSEFPDAIEFGMTDEQHWVKLPREVVEDRRKETVQAKWRDAVVIVDSQVSDTEVLLAYVGPPAKAKELGMDGDQYMGWTVVAPIAELEDVSTKLTGL